MKKTIFMVAISGLAFSTYAQNEFIDNFDDGVVNNLKYESFNAVLTENSSGMEVTPISNQEIGGVIVKPELPTQGFSFSNPNARNSYELIIRPEFTSIDETALIEVKGEGGFVIESYLISNSDKKIYYTNRDKYGNIETSLFGSFSTDTDIIIQRAREYSWWPPVCSGPRCDYGIDIPDLLIFARWRIGAVARTQDNPPSAESTINPVTIDVKSKSKMFITKFAIRDFIPELTHPLLGLKTENKFYRQNSGSQVTLKIDQSFFNQLTNINITVDGIQTNNIQVVSDTELSFIPPQNLPKGEKHIIFSAFSATENTQYEIQIDENLSYHSSISPLVIDDFDISKSLLETNQTYLIKLQSSGGGHKNHHFELISGALPSGMNLTPSGNLVGKPNNVGVYGFFVKASDNTGEEFIKLFFIEVQQGASNKSLNILTEETDKISFYPNPVENILNVDLSKQTSNTKSSIKVLNLSGQIVYSSTTLENSIQIDFSSFLNGQYILEVEQGNNLFIEKINIIK